LERIRIEALGTQDLLAVPESGLLGSQTSDNFIAANYVRPPDSENVEKNIQEAEQEAETSESQNGWKALIDALTPTEIKALKILLQNSITLKQFADENKIMLEVLADNINEKANDHIGDNILDEEFEIYEDYKDKLIEMAEIND